jgi:hypothetical protein
VLRSLHSPSVAEAGTEEVAVVVSTEEAEEEVAVVVSMEEAEEEVASTAAVVEADSMEVVGVMAAERIAAEVVVCTAAVRRAAPLEEWVHMDAAACMAAGVRMEGMAERVRMARTAAGRAEIQRTRGTARARVRGVRIR